MYLLWIIAAIAGYGLAGFALVRFINGAQNAAEFAIAALLIFMLEGFIDLFINYRDGRKGHWTPWWIGVVLSLLTVVTWRADYPSIVTFMLFIGGLILLQAPIWRKYPT